MHQILYDARILDRLEREPWSIPYLIWEFINWIVKQILNYSRPFVLSICFSSRYVVLNDKSWILNFKALKNCSHKTVITVLTADSSRFWPHPRQWCFLSCPSDQDRNVENICVKVTCQTKLSHPGYFCEVTAAWDARGHRFVNLQ